MILFRNATNAENHVMYILIASTKVAIYCLFNVNVQAMQGCFQTDKMYHYLPEEEQKRFVVEWKWK
jgi:hypothetical protein